MDSERITIIDKAATLEIHQRIVIKENKLDISKESFFLPQPSET